MALVGARRILAMGAPLLRSPADLPGLVLWLKAGRITGLVNNDPVASWSDLSASGTTFVQATGTKQPLYKTNAVNGKPSVLFDGVDDCLAAVLAIPQPFTMLIVADPPDAPSANAAVIGGSTGAIGAYAIATTNVWGLYMGGSVLSPVPALGSFQLFTGVANGASSLAQVNNGAPAVGNAGSTGFVLNTGIGAFENSASPAAVSIAEIVIYSGVKAAAPLSALSRRYFAPEYALMVA